MPYNSIKELPKGVQHVLPPHAQEIYMSSFNNALGEYSKKEKRRHPDDDLEVVCHRVAWSAVKNKYYKNEKDEWIEK